MLNTLFFGTPDTAVPFLKTLAEKSRVRAVICSPDKPTGRGYALTAPPVKTAAISLGLPVLQPPTLRDPKVLEEISRFGPVDLGIVVAYGKIIPSRVFSFPRLGLMNVHFSLLPKYRGAAPMQWALIRGENETGVSLFQIEEGLDTGPIYLQEATKIDPEDNAKTLRNKLIDIGTKLLDQAIVRFEREPWAPTPQTSEKATSAPSLRKEQGLLRWNEISASEAVNLIRGTYEWPQAFGYLKGQMLKILNAKNVTSAGSPGTIVGVERGRGFLIACKEGSVLVLEVQPEGKKSMDAWSFWNGARLTLGDSFENGPLGQKESI